MIYFTFRHVIMPSSEVTAGHNPSRISIDNGTYVQNTKKFSTVQDESTKNTSRANRNYNFVFFFMNIYTQSIASNNKLSCLDPCCTYWFSAKTFRNLQNQPTHPKHFRQHQLTFKTNWRQSNKQPFVLNNKHTLEARYGI